MCTVGNPPHIKLIVNFNPNALEVIERDIKTAEAYIVV